MLVGMVKCHVMVVVYVDLIMFPFFLTGQSNIVFLKNWFQLKTFFLFLSNKNCNVCLFVCLCLFFISFSVVD